jgi:hypothetical protein
MPIDGLIVGPTEPKSLNRLVSEDVVPLVRCGSSQHLKLAWLLSRILGDNSPDFVVTFGRLVLTHRQASCSPSVASRISKTDLNLRRSAFRRRSLIEVLLQRLQAIARVPQMGPRVGVEDLSGGGPPRAPQHRGNGETLAVFSHFCRNICRNIWRCVSPRVSPEMAEIRVCLGGGTIIEVWSAGISPSCHCPA